MQLPHEAQDLFRRRRTLESIVQITSSQRSAEQLRLD